MKVTEDYFGYIFYRPLGGGGESPKETRNIRSDLCLPRSGSSTKCSKSIGSRSIASSYAKPISTDGPITFECMVLGPPPLACIPMLWGHPWKWALHMTRRLTSNQ